MSRRVVRADIAAWMGETCPAAQARGRALCMFIERQRRHLAGSDRLCRNLGNLAAWLSRSRRSRNRPRMWEAENAPAVTTRMGAPLPHIRRFPSSFPDNGLRRQTRSYRGLPFRGVYPMMRLDGYAPSWVSKPKQKHPCAGDGTGRFPIAFASGSHGRMSRLHG